MVTIFSYKVVDNLHAEIIRNGIKALIKKTAIQVEKIQRDISPQFDNVVFKRFKHENFFCKILEKKTKNVCPIRANKEIKTANTKLLQQMTERKCKSSAQTNSGDT